MATLIRDLDPDVIGANLRRVREEIADAGRDVDSVEILAAVKYVPIDELPALAEAGITLVGENRVQDLVAKRERYGNRFTWDFIGRLQSRKVRQVVDGVRLIHSVATDSVLEQLGRHAPSGIGVLVQVNVAREPGKDGVAPDELTAFIARCPVTVAGLMTMPPLAEAPEDSRPHFRALRMLAESHGLTELSMGTSQDYRVAVEEGATIVRLGTSLYARGAS